MKPLSKTTIAVIGGIIGFCIGILCANIPSYLKNVKGDISKSSKYSKNMVFIRALAFQELMANNPESFSKEEEALKEKCASIIEFDDLVTLAIKTGEGIEELKPAIKKIKSIRTVTANGRQAAENAVAAFSALAAGDLSSFAEYEKASQRMNDAYSMMEKNINVGKEYVNCVDAYLLENGAAGNRDLSQACDRWARFCTRQARISGKTGDIEYWSHSLHDTL